MRLTGMTRLPLIAAAIALSAGLPLVAVNVLAQGSAPPGTGNTFKDTSLIKPPAGAKVAVYEFEDMECPACAVAYPTVHAAIEHYKIPLVRRDFPLGPSHPWSFEAAVDARFIQDKISPKIADEYRGAVFGAQNGISNKDDLLRFTRQFFEKHGGQMPFVVDPTGQFANEVKADRALGDKVGLSQTPTIFVCTAKSWVQVTKPSELYQTIEQAEASAGASTGPVKKAGR